MQGPVPGGGSQAGLSRNVNWMAALPLCFGAWPPWVAVKLNFLTE